ncbi:hypothetical protein IEN85_14310 [Pelagicoccus sp. NFK12]|uniref:Uncharacterized protein n=1 Tax=Pelagicoccus enzymogenes TaxID=2773457 RepID=A0A927FA66_9BACT|nr:DUF6880 family protein [Pelagicoccus enzymogenes]MBD5780670.1 hypothetical protein [Pelagicoccus enzymogenes]
MPTANQLAKKLSKSRLAELLAEACLTNEALASRVEIELLGDKAAVVAKTIENRIDSLTANLDYIDYRQASHFGQELDTVVQSIEQNLLPLDPDLTLAICYHFLDTDEEVFNLVDDSDGSIGDPYRNVADLFSQAAVNAQDRLTVVDLTLDCIRNNNYGARDPIMSQAAHFLTNEEFASLLHALRQYFLDAPKQKFRSSEQFHYEFVAQSKGDPELFRRVLAETKKGELSGYDRIQLARTLCQSKRWQEALDLVQAIEAKGSWVQMIEDIRLQAYQGLGKKEEVAAIRNAAFRSSPSPETLQAWLASIPLDKPSPARAEAIAYAESSTCNAYTVLSFLMQIKETDRAAAYAQRHIDRLSGRYWEILPKYAREFEAKHPLAATLLYRKLLEDILDSARSKAYHHAADYWHALSQIASRIQFPDTVEDETAYKIRLTEKHKRKTSFQRALNERA